jgi:RNA polymerase sigma-70 factor (ECF subfamily)
MDDIAIIRQVLAGDRDAFRVLVVRYQRPIFRFLHSYRLSPAQREEIAQEAFTRAYQNLSRFDLTRATPFSSWLFTIAKNLAAHAWDRAAHQREQLVATLPEHAVDTEPVAQARLENAERRSLVALALAGLPAAFRNAVVLSCLKELSLEEIAAIEDCSVGTVKSRIFRGKQLLRAALIETEG